MDLTEGQRQAVRRAAAILARKAYSCFEVYDKLLRKETAPEDAAFAVSYMVEMGALDDCAYAQMLARSYFARGYGRMRVLQVLRRHGLSQDEIDRALSMPRPDSGEQIEALLRQKLPSSPDRRAIGRAVNALRRRGFSYDEVNAALRRVLAGEADDF